MNRKLLTLAMVILVLLGWYTVYDATIGTREKMDQALSQAEELEERELYLSAVSVLNDAIDYGADQEQTKMRIADDYNKMGDQDSYKKTLQQVVNLNYANGDAVRKLFDYNKNQSLMQAIDFIKPLYRSHPDDETIRQLYDSVKGETREMNIEADDISAPHNGYMIYTSDSLAGVINTSAGIVLKSVFDYAGMPLNQDTLFPVVENGEAFYVTSKGYKSAQPTQDYDWLSMFCGNYAIARKDNKYGYIDKDMNVAAELQWDDCTLINGIGAVKKDDKWALIDGNLQTITDYIYDDVIRDDIGICSRNGIVFVKKDGGYILVDTKGVQIGEETFDNAREFVSDEPAAVCKDGKWGFVGTDGLMKIECQYDEAGSFNIDYAPVKDGSSWGYIDNANNMVIEPIYQEARTFSSSGCAPVKNNDFWTLIQLQVYVD